MTQSKDIVNFRVTKQEKEILQEYCELTGRTQTDVYSPHSAGAIAKHCIFEA